MGWWIAAAVVGTGLLVFWVWMARFTDHGARSRDFEDDEREISEALREAQRGGDMGNFFHHR